MPYFLAAIGIAITSFWLASNGEFDALAVWWIVIILYFPLLIIAAYARYVSLVTICALTFSTQFFTVPNFYISRDSFKWGGVKPFDFSFTDALPILLKVFLFLFFLILFFLVFYKVIPGYKSYLESYKLFKLDPVGRKRLAGIQLPVRNRNVWVYIVIILTIVAVVAPLNFWMFSKGISIVGVEPPKLPFHLSGILHYLTKYIIPLLLGYLYSKTNRSVLPMSILLVYAWVLGMTSVSRSALVLVMLPVLSFALLDRRYLMLIVAGAGTLLGFAGATLARSYVHVLSNGKLAGVVSEVDVFTILKELLSDFDSGLLESWLIINTLISVFDRIDGFGNLVMSQYYDPNEVIGSLGFILRMLSRRLAPWDQDLHHIQWQGFTLPEGFVNGGGLLSNAVILGNDGVGWIIFSAMISAFTLVVLEKSVLRLFSRYGWSKLAGAGLIVFLTITYFIETGGSDVFVVPFIFLFVLSVAPVLYRFKRKQC